MKLLVVEDNALVRLALVAALRRREPEFQITEAASVAEGYREALRSHPVVLLSDVELPDGSGLALARWLKEENPALRVIVNTASDSPEYRAAAEELGADGFFTKDPAEGAFLDTIADFALRLAAASANVPAPGGARRQVA